MSIVRDLPTAVISLSEMSLITCSTGNQLFASTAYSGPSSTFTNGIAGRVIDRLDEFAPRYLVAWPVTNFYSTRGSTEADRKITLGATLQHGDSSGGGDMAAYRNESDVTAVSYFSTARTSDMQSWEAGNSTGGTSLRSAPATYDLRAAKRYIRAVHYATKNKVTTESSGDEGGRVSGIVILGGSDNPGGIDLPAPKIPWASNSTTT